jgi:hypothetical protein
MKCLDSCGFNQKPDNIVVLKQHLIDCSTTGAISHLPEKPQITWKDGEFVVVQKTTKKDRVFDIEFQSREVVELTDRMVKEPTPPSKPKISRGKIDTNSKKNSTNIPEAEIEKNSEVFGD